MLSDTGDEATSRNDLVVFDDVAWVNYCAQVNCFKYSDKLVHFERFALEMNCYPLSLNQKSACTLRKQG